ncbi:outer membrane beta-barrel family protein [Solitalea sp. MAHUQ-68]|uniref:Outer membrane beta-barrel family protein n=1 Tax=Solitalea agri TaxID=2953739 RepID=A0A9X2F4A2_9SPHI|nr:outer membrane beta-barrel protein [Solitalea agri]MCO4294036.1 outer membrane beta-barrel family protein [Solitalea agri]
MKKNILLLFFGFLQSSALFAQKYISLKDSVTNRVVPAAIVKLIRAENNKLLHDVEANEYGVVLIPDSILKITPLVKVVCWHADYKNNLITVNFAAIKDTAIIRLLPLKQTLTEVTVSAKAVSLKQDAKGVKLDLLKEKNAKHWQLWEALKQIPGIEIDEQSMEVKYLGKRVGFEINGIASNAFLANLSTYLRMPSVRFSQIELEYYDPKQDGAVVINLVSNSPAKDGVGGTLNASVDLTTQLLSIPLFLKRKQHLFEMLTSINFNSMPKIESESGTTYLQSNNFLQAQNSNHSESKSFSTRLHTNHQLGKKHILDTEFGLRTNNNSSETYGGQQEWREISLYRSITSQNNKKGTGNAYSAGLTYLFQPQKDHKLQFSVDWDGSLNNNARMLESIIIGPALPTFNYSKKSEDEEKNFYSMLSYEYTHKQLGAFEAGFKYFNRNHESNFEYHLKQREGSADSLLLRASQNNYHFSALFLTWSRKLKRISMFASMKSDYSKDKITAITNTKYSFFTYAPHLSIQAKLDDKGVHNVSFSTGYKQLRPSLSSTNPIDDIQSGNNIIRGNPNLMPERNWYVNALYLANLQKLTFTLSSSFNRTKDAITGYSKVENDSVVVSGYDNLGLVNSGFVTLTVSYKPFPRITITPSLNGSINRFKNGLLTATSYPWNAEIDADYNAGKYVLLSSKVEYTKGDYFQLRNEGYFTTRLSASYVKGNVNASIFFNNINRFYNTIESVNEAEGLVRNVIIKNRQGNLGFSLFYNFGLSRVASQKGKGIEKDDVK